MNAADLYEFEVAHYINELEGVNAHRPDVSVKYSDVIVEYNDNSAWLEVKMNHTDNLGNTRVSYNGEEWVSNKKDGEIAPLKDFCVEALNNCPQAAYFIEDLKEFTGRDYLRVPTTRGGLKDEYAVPLTEMKAFFEDRNRYIIQVEDQDLGELVTQHYTLGKAEPAHYMAAGDDLYRIGEENPLGVTDEVPVLVGYGTFKVRVSTRSKFYEVQPEVKIMSMESSPFSVKPGSLKPHPFVI